MAQYGRTWWGLQWLKALDRIDFSNRLPRGRSYAKKGMISSVSINGHIISAKVQGSRPKPYDVTIVVPPFTDTEKKLLLQNIKTNPLLISQLLNRQLPQELLDIAGKNSIRIFPQSWQDIKLNCSCPDWAVPCKHLAAVIYVMANEIDQNPFLVFNLHKCDLINELSSRELRLKHVQAEKISSIQDCIAEKKFTTTKNENIVTPDFSVIENLLATLPLLFTARPLFYTGDFKALIQDHYRRNAKYEEIYLASLKKARTTLTHEYRYYRYTLVFDQSSEVNFIIQTPEGKNILSAKLEDLLILLACTESKHLDNYSRSFVYMYRTFRFCNVLVERGAMLPRLFACADGKYRIQWLPAVLNASVKKICDDVLQWYPAEMIKINLASSYKKTGGKRSAAVLKYAKPDEALMLLCALFLGNSVQKCYNNTWAGHKFSCAEDRKVAELFFDNTIHRFTNFSEREYPNTIQLWLGRFYITKKDYSPLLQVSELKGNGGFELEVLMKDHTAPLQPVERLSSFLDKAGDMQFAALKDLQLLSHYMPELNDIIASRGKKALHYTAQTFTDVLTQMLPAIRMFGIQTLLPKSLRAVLYPQLSVGLKAKNGNKQFLSLEELIDFDWKVAMGNTFINPEEFIKLAKQSSGLVKIRDQYIMLNQEEVEKIIKKLAAPSAPKAFTLLQAALSGDYDGAPVLIGDGLQRKIKEILRAHTVSLPSALQAQVRHYQHRGFSWLYKNAQLGIGSLLADDMGLGKTLQVISLLLKLKEERKLTNKPSLVIAPTSLLSNWKAEIEKFAPALKAFIFHGISRNRDFKSTDVVLTTYGVARSDNEQLCKQQWQVLVIDEAQNIKNSEVAQTRAVKKIKAGIKIAMSGTPVENRLVEYWSIFDFANPGYLGSAPWFNDEYAKPIEINQDKNRLEKFRKITQPFIMRRVKTDKTVISDLPDKIESNQYCNLSKEQAALYKSVTTDLMQEVEKAEGITRRGLILKLLTILKQVCNHPAQYLKNNDSPLPQESGKMILLLQLLETIYENDEKVLIFSQYKEMGDLLRRVLHEHFGKKALQLHGGNTRKERDEMVYSFQNNALSDTFILSLRAGGTGLNLTAANHVIHYDLWWNPAVEAQATDRAFRIGQKKNVMVHRLLTKETLEEKIDAMLHSKKQLAGLTVTNGEKWIGELSDREIKELVMLGG